MLSKEEARRQALTMLQHGQRVYSVLQHHTSAGTRIISTYCIVPDENGVPDMRCLDYVIAPLLGLGRSAKYNYGIVTGGFGLDCGHELAYNLGICLFNDGRAFEHHWL